MLLLCVVFVCLSTATGMCCEHVCVVFVCLCVAVVVLLCGCTVVVVCLSTAAGMCCEHVCVVVVVCCCGCVVVWLYCCCVWFRGRPIIGADIKHFTDYRYRPFSKQIC